VDGRVAFSATKELVEIFLSAATRTEYGSDYRCPACSSYQLTRHWIEGDEWMQVCSACEWSGPADPPAPMIENRRNPDDNLEDSGGECATLDDFRTSLTPGQARRIFKDQSLKDGDGEEQPNWANPSGFRFPEDRSIHDVHRLVFSSFNHEPAPGSELVYDCDDDSCVNPKHAKEVPLLADVGWELMIEGYSGGRIEVQTDHD
jgi:hypothetical protein